MPIYTVQSPDGKTYDIEGPEGATPEQLGEFISKAGPKPYDVEPWVQSAMNVGQALTFGFGDEIAGKLGADPERYKATVENFRKEYPASATLGSVAGSMLLPFGGAKLAGYAPMATAAAIGGATGIASGFGESEEGKRLEGGVKGGVMGTALGPAAILATKAASPLTSLFNPLLAKNTAYSDWLARNRVADSFTRDGMTADQVKNRLVELGSEARIADAAGENTRNLLNTNAYLPGRTADDLEKTIRSRIANRPERMDEVVYQVNGGFGKGNDLIKVFQEERKAIATPLYKQAHSQEVNPSPQLWNDLQAAQKLGAFAEAEKRALANPEFGPFTLGASQQKLGQGKVSVRDIDHIKQGLDSLIERETDTVSGKVSGYGRDLVKLKQRMLGEVDALVPEYQKARQAFAGPTALENAVKKGRAFWNEDADSLTSLMDGMTRSEQEAFRVGAADQLRKMVGEQTGQNRLLDIWKNRNTKEKMQALLGDDVKYSQVEKFLAGEETLKRLERLGPSRNSRTAQVMAGAEQQTADNAVDIASAALGKGGGLGAILQAARQRSALIGTPEKVRDKTGSLLLSKYSTADMEALRLAQEAIKARQQAAAAALGTMSGKEGKGLLDF